MTKKHFIALADMVRTVKPKRIFINVSEENEMYESGYEAGLNEGAMAAWESMRDSLAQFCASQNSQFNRKRWLDYIAGECGPNGGAVKGGRS